MQEQQFGCWLFEAVLVLAFGIGVVYLLSAGCIDATSTCTHSAPLLLDSSLLAAAQLSVTLSYQSSCQVQMSVKSCSCDGPF